MNKQRIFSISILIFAIMAGLYFVYRDWNQFASLRIERPFLLLPLSGLMLLFFVVNGYVSAIWYRTFAVHLNFVEWFGLSVVNTFGNFITPFRGGAVSNAVYLKRRHGFAIAAFVGVLAATSVIAFWLNAVVGLVSLAWIYWSYGYFSMVALLVFGGGFAALTGVIWFAPRVGEPANPFLARFARAVNGWHQIKSYRKQVLETALLNLLNVVLMTTITMLEFRVLGLELPLAKALFLSIFPAFSLLVSITPGNLGIREGFAVFSGMVASVAVPEVLAVSVLDRLMTFGLSFVLSTAFYPLLARRAAKA
jgi:uncharacterized membrane protein YbhN (UPF0104 family)